MFLKKGISSLTRRLSRDRDVHVTTPLTVGSPVRFARGFDSAARSGKLGIFSITQRIASTFLPSHAESVLARVAIETIACKRGKPRGQEAAHTLPTRSVWRIIGGLDTIFALRSPESVRHLGI